MDTSENTHRQNHPSPHFGVQPCSEGIRKISPVLPPAVRQGWQRNRQTWHHCSSEPGRPSTVTGGAWIPTSPAELAQRPGKGAGGAGASCIRIVKQVPMAQPNSAPRNTPTPQNALFHLCTPNCGRWEWRGEWRQSLKTAGLHRCQLGRKRLAESLL